MSRLQEMRQQRLEKLHKLQALGFDAYPAQSHRTHTNAQVVDHFAELEGKTVTLAGRLTTLRDHSKLMFGDLHDMSGKIQLYIRPDSLTRTDASTQTLGYDDLNLLDTGDIIQATGTVTKTQRGEISLQPTHITLLTKALRPMPDKWDGLQDPEIKFRRRYLDLAINPDSRAMFERKAKFWRANREFMAQKGFIEVETPVLEHVTGGADARPFTTHMNALDQEFFLRISTELYQKRLIGGGFEKIFTIGPNFRNEGLSDEHLPEYYQIEWYWAYADYRDNMALIEEMFKYIAQEVWGKSVFEKNGLTFDVSQKWEEISYPDIIKERLGIDIFTDSDDKMRDKVRELGIKLTGVINRQRLIDNLWKSIRKTLPGPAFLVNEPKFMSPLAKSKIDNPELTQRFHVIIAGSELGNGYSELNDPIDQLARFQDQQAAREAGDDEAQMLDIDYVEMLEYGMPPTSGYGMSERVFWFLEGVTAREGTLFPTLRHHMEEVTKEIYGMGKSEPKVVTGTISSFSSETTTAATGQIVDELPDENSRRFIAILNKKIEPGKLMNALGHMTAGLTGQFEDMEEMHFLQYLDKDKGVHPSISHFPFIILSAENSNQIRTVRKEALQRGILFSDFTSTMTVGTSKAQLTATADSPEAELEYFGICMFGKTVELREFTKKFSLLK